MRSRLVLVLCPILLAGSLTACATGAGAGGLKEQSEVSQPSQTSESALPPEGADPAALAQAQAWLDAATLPPGALRSETSIGGFMSYTGWPCGPVEELEGFWKIPGATAGGTAKWLVEHPPANLVTTVTGPINDDPAVDSGIVGFIPEPGAQEGIVYTIAKTADGVVVRAEVAAQTESAVCPPLPDGGMYGAPGQG